MAEFNPKDDSQAKLLRVIVEDLSPKLRAALIAELARFELEQKYNQVKTKSPQPGGVVGEK